MIPPLVAFALVIFGYAIVAGRLAATPFSAAIVFVVFGALIGPEIFALIEERDTVQLLPLTLEAALVMVLFADAAAINVRRFTRERSLDVRLLGIGLPLTIVAGTLVALVLLPELPLWQAALLGAILAPTDAALGQAVVANPRVPRLVRNALNVESGLNDGLVLPVITLLIAVGLASEGETTDVAAIETFLRALVGSTVVGLIVGWLGGRALRAASERGWSSGPWLAVAMIMVPVVAYQAAVEIEGSGFIGVWVAGFVVGMLARDRLENAHRLTEGLADLLTAAAFFGFGAFLLVPALQAATPVTVVYVLLSLTVVRMVPVALSLVGSGLALPSLLYIGWFGPRGLASIVFAGLVIEEAVPGASPLVQVVMLTVGFSVVLHGASAAWGARRYAGWYERTIGAGVPLAEAGLTGSLRGRLRMTAGQPDERSGAPDGD